VTNWPGWNEEIAHTSIGVYAKEPGGLLPALHALQEAFGCVDQRSIDLAADVFNLSRAEVYGVVSFYDDFRSEPPALPVLKICAGEACQAVGAASLKAHAAEKSAALVEIEDIFCLGNCACGPAVMSGSTVHGRVTQARLDDIVRGLQGEET
jgi:formate dehydrogenase subunit gamma